LVTSFARYHYKNQIIDSCKNKHTELKLVLVPP
jgi:hypothetical protein